MTSPEARAKLVEALQLDIVGPGPGHVFAHELLPENPNRWYLTGYLVPEEAPLEHKSDAESQDEPDAGGEGGGMDDNTTPDKAAVTPSLLPSSIGLSVLIAPNTKKLEIEVSWGDYLWEDPEKAEAEPTDDGLGVKAEEDGAYPQVTGESDTLAEPALVPVGTKPPKGFRRSPHLETLGITLPPADGKLVTHPVPNSSGLIIALTLRPVSSDPRNRIPTGTHALCVFLVNKRRKAERAYQGNAFQARLRLTSGEALIPRPDLRGCTEENASQDWDSDIADLQYRCVFDYVSGIGCSAEPINVAEGGPCYCVQTCWIPSAEVEFVGHLDNSALPGVELGMEALAKIVSVDEARAKLSKLVEHYRAWIIAQASAIAAETGIEQTRRETADELIHRASKAADRITAGIESLALDDVREAFCTANRVMARQARQREAQRLSTTPDNVSAPAWRAFQLGFILLNLRGLHEPTHPDRELVDLLFFPTGGGKTEAYLGLAAFSLVLRRLRNPGPRGGGVNVLMRYTLRLLTLDQLGRAAALICAMELERHERNAAGDARLGDWPFEIGLWVGSTATPNRMGGPNDNGPGKETTAYSRTNKFKRDSSRNPSPIPLENCPWCGEKFDAKSFNLIPFKGPPKDLRITCVNAKCAFTGDRHLPIVAVDESIYRRLPCFLIATVDKFAALPWMGPSGKLFGQVERHHKAATDIGTDGFYSVAEPGIGKPLGGPLLPPELIIQDELHLISGPLGTIAGIFETAIGHLSERDLGNGQRLRPKIIASTATVRQAEAQIRSLFGREHSRVFPPPGPDRRDTFFSKTHPSTQTPARLYLGVAAQGRSLKVVLLRTSLALLSGGQQLYKQAGGKSATNPLDPYMTLLGYFNSLRELGGSRRIVEDEVTSQLERYGNRKRRDPVDNLFAKRKVGEPRELTSRVSTDTVADVKRRLSQNHNEDDHVDIALSASNLAAFATALEADWVAPTSPEKLFRTYAGDHASALRQWLRHITGSGFSLPQASRLIHAVIAGRARDQILAPDLVVSGPDVPGVPTADTYSVVQSLFQEASTEVVVAGYAFYNGKALFERLHEQLIRNPSLKIIFHVDVPRRYGDATPPADLLKKYTDDFRLKHWPWEPLPEIYFDPRALESESKTRASLHAKVVSIDRRKLLITSANFTEAAQQKNIELGVLCSLPYLAERVCSYFEGLRKSGQLRRLG